MNVGRYLRGEDRHVGTARTTQPQPQQRTEQEPVAWQDTRKTWVDVPLKNVLKEKRIWVGLTDREMMDAIHMDDSPMEMGRKIEAKLKEKNGG